MKNQASFSSKDKSKKLKCHLLQFFVGALRVNTNSVLSGAMVYLKAKINSANMPFSLNREILIR